MNPTPTILLNGEWRVGAALHEVRSPADGALQAVIGNAGKAETQAAIDAAAHAFETWRRTTGMARSAVLAKTATLMQERAEDIGRTLSLESGKLLREAIGEVRFSADYFSWFAGEARRFEWASGVHGRNGGPQLVLKKPAGVVATLTPWNFPVSIQARKVAPALAAGCTVVARPSEQAPLSVVKMFQCLVDAGIPAGVVNLVIGPAGPITDALMDDARVRVVTFTGSTPVGQMLVMRAAATMKRLALELGGCAPFIVCEDADLPAAVEQAMIAKFRNYGQSCIAANTFFVHAAHFDAFVGDMAARVCGLRPGDPLQDATTMGPVINARRKRELEQVQAKALENGFSAVAAGPMVNDGDFVRAECYLPPALLAARRMTDVPPAFIEQEIFGPIALVVGFEDVDALLALLARQPLGLASYVFARDAAKAIRIAARLETGIVGVNDGLPSAANVPMGGVKLSGLGREGGHMGMEEFLDTQYLALKESLV